MKTSSLILSIVAGLALLIFGISIILQNKSHAEFPSVNSKVVKTGSFHNLDIQGNMNVQLTYGPEFQLKLEQHLHTTQLPSYHIDGNTLFVMYHDSINGTPLKVSIEFPEMDSMALVTDQSHITLQGLKLENCQIQVSNSGYLICDSTQINYLSVRCEKGTVELKNGRIGKLQSRLTTNSNLMMFNPVDTLEIISDSTSTFRKYYYAAHD